jgi:hypothetical protein
MPRPQIVGIVGVLSDSMDGPSPVVGVVLVQMTNVSLVGAGSVGLAGDGLLNTLLGFETTSPLSRT